jgi:hypothetical protein
MFPPFPLFRNEIRRCCVGSLIRDRAFRAPGCAAALGTAGRSRRIGARAVRIGDALDSITACYRGRPPSGTPESVEPDWRPNSPAPSGRAGPRPKTPSSTTYASSRDLLTARKCALATNASAPSRRTEAATIPELTPPINIAGNIPITGLDVGAQIRVPIGDFPSSPYALVGRERRGNPGSVHFGCEAKKHKPSRQSKETSGKEACGVFVQSRQPGEEQFRTAA